MTAQEYIENNNMGFYNMTFHETGLVEISYDDLTDLMESYAKCSLHNVVGRSEQLTAFAEYCDEEHGLFIPSWMIDGYNKSR